MMINLLICLIVMKIVNYIYFIFVYVKKMNIFYYYNQLKNLKKICSIHHIIINNKNLIKNSINNNNNTTKKQNIEHMLTSSSLLFKNIRKINNKKSLFSHIQYNSSTKFAGFTDRVYQKLTVKRFPQ